MSFHQPDLPRKPEHPHIKFRITGYIDNELAIHYGMRLPGSMVGLVNAWTLDQVYPHKPCSMYVLYKKEYDDIVPQHVLMQEEYHTHWCPGCNPYPREPFIDNRKALY